MKKVTRTKRFFQRLALALCIPTNYFEFTGTHRHQLHHAEIKLGSIKQGSIRVLHLSDFHASPVVPYRFIQKAVELGIAQKPDIICITGDFATHYIPQPYDEYVKILKMLSETAPTFACFGNHDCCYPSDSVTDFNDSLAIGKMLNDAKINILFNQKATVEIRGQQIELVGLGDLGSKTMLPGAVMKKVREGASISCCQPNFVENTPVNYTNETLEIPRILLSHNPDTKHFLYAYNWDVMLCGHTHGGQINFPIFGAFYAPVSDCSTLEGLHRWKDRYVYVTRGVGNVFGMRYHCDPWISILDLKPL